MILVTGGTGTVGSRLVELLLDSGERVRVLSRNAGAARSKLGDRAEVAQGDFGDPESVGAALRGADRVFLLTPSAPEPNQQLQHERTVIAAAKQAGVRHVVKQSVLGADERSPMRYARWHREAEKELEASGLAYTILRPAAFMQGFFESVTDDRIYTCAEDGRVAMVDARDIAAVAKAALCGSDHEGRTYTLTGPEAVSYDEAAATLSAATGRTIRHVRVPPAGVIERISAAGLPQWLAEDLAAQFGVFAADRGAIVSDDVATVSGREPRSLDE
ncbi:MAG: SDR family oxidoreductase, partial [Thermoleophilaceae bacterium]